MRAHRVKWMLRTLTFPPRCRLCTPTSGGGHPVCRCGVIGPHMFGVRAWKDWRRTHLGEQQR